MKTALELGECGCVHLRGKLQSKTCERQAVSEFCDCVGMNEGFALGQVDSALWNPLLPMPIANFFPGHEEAWERGIRVINALTNKAVDLIRREMSKDVVLSGGASGEALWGVGYDFFCDAVFVRIHGVRAESLKLPRGVVSCHVCALGRLVNAYVENRVLVISVKPDDYKLVGTS